VLHVHDDGSENGPRLFAGGFFTSNLVSDTSYLAEWDGVALWNSVGNPAGGVLGMETFDPGDGDGPRLLVIGLGGQVAGVTVGNAAVFDRSTWSMAGQGLNFSPVCSAVHVPTAGGPPQLFVGGDRKSYYPPNGVLYLDDPCTMPSGGAGQGQTMAARDPQTMGSSQVQ
jgi:hypothetical protein